MSFVWETTIGMNLKLDLLRKCVVLLRIIKWWDIHVSNMYFLIINGHFMLFRDMIAPNCLNHTKHTRKVRWQPADIDVRAYTVRSESHCWKWCPRASVQAWTRLILFANTFFRSACEMFLMYAVIAVFNSLSVHGRSRYTADFDNQVYVP
jgi:hypothetical protein